MSKVLFKCGLPCLTSMVLLAGTTSSQGRGPVDCATKVAQCTASFDCDAFQRGMDPKIYLEPRIATKLCDAWKSERLKKIQKLPQKDQADATNYAAKYVCWKTCVDRLWDPGHCNSSCGNNPNPGRGVPVGS